MYVLLIIVYINNMKVLIGAKILGMTPLLDIFNVHRGCVLLY